LAERWYHLDGLDNAHESQKSQENLAFGRNPELFYEKIRPFCKKIGLFDGIKDSFMER